jgi:hypothetical protein
MKLVATYWRARANLHNRQQHDERDDGIILTTAGGVNHPVVRYHPASFLAFPGGLRTDELSDAVGRWHLIAIPDDQVDVVDVPSERLADALGVEPRELLVG